MLGSGDSDVGGDVFQFNAGTAAKDDHALDDVFQFPDIPRKTVAGQHGHGFRGYGYGWLTQSAGHSLQEELGEKLNVSRAFPQGWEGDADHVEAVVEVLAELLGQYGCLEVAIGGG